MERWERGEARGSEGVIMSSIVKCFHVSASIYIYIYISFDNTRKCYVFSHLKSVAYNVLCVYYSVHICKRYRLGTSEN